MKSEIFQGSYVDFIDFDVLTRDGLKGAFDAPPRIRTYMFDDLYFYFEHHSRLLFERKERHLH
ncbi:6222efab-782c-4311-94ae-7b4096c16ca7-CDS [Sclerotinia trifoliorum]|uniref:6222efab-782c-4311-94ae-7b4096c16ca7-CDS n=1 Tax=Sclerotinia trifoliorum TaxID=28548 RepID=A0A8H2W2Z2_9HELO|nr:6222efab-782c-4311-94ae-7b4096c16ca7-CDS [Sclerotinia trifoliorum]